MVDELRKLEPMVRATVDSYIDQFINDGEVDISKRLLHISSLTAALKFMGVPAEDMEKIHQFSMGHATATWARPPQRPSRWLLPTVCSGSTPSACWTS